MVFVFSFQNEHKMFVHIVPQSLPIKYKNSRESLLYLKEPMPGMLRVGLGKVKQLYCGWISLHLSLEELSVIVHIPVIKGQSCSEASKITKLLLTLLL